MTEEQNRNSHFLQDVVEYRLGASAAATTVATTIAATTSATATTATAAT